MAKPDEVKLLETLLRLDKKEGRKIYPLCYWRKEPKFLAINDDGFGGHNSDDSDIWVENDNYIIVKPCKRHLKEYLKLSGWKEV